MPSNAIVYLTLPGFWWFWPFAAHVLRDLDRALSKIESPDHDKWQ